MTHILEGEGKDGLEACGAEEPHRILNRYTYDAFGNTIDCEEQVHNRFRYNGEQYDPVTSQYYLRARFYNPAIARFTQEDTYYGDGLNLYQYCANNPVGYQDPDGHKVCPVQDALYRKYREKGYTAQEAFKKMREDLGLSKENPNNQNTCQIIMVLNKSPKVMYYTMITAMEDIYLLGKIYTKCLHTMEDLAKIKEENRLC